MEGIVIPTISNGTAYEGGVMAKWLVDNVGPAKCNQGMHENCLTPSQNNKIPQSTWQFLRVYGGPRSGAASPVRGTK
jgi:hypothetical protein